MKWATLGLVLLAAATTGCWTPARQTYGTPYAPAVYPQPPAVYPQQTMQQVVPQQVVVQPAPTVMPAQAVTACPPGHVPQVAGQCPPGYVPVY